MNTRLVSLRVTRGLCATVGMAASLWVAAADGMGSQPTLFAGAILLDNPAPSRVGTPSAAQRQVDAAQAHIQADTGTLPTVELIDPSTVTPSPSGRSATDNRSRARKFLSNNGQPTTQSDPQVPLASVPGNLGAGAGAATAPSQQTGAARAESAAAKARRYANGADAGLLRTGTYVRLGTAIGMAGADGVLEFNCSDTDNIAGRVGDAIQPGQIFTVVLSGRPMKARCK